MMNKDKIGTLKELEGEMITDKKTYILPVWDITDGKSINMRMRPDMYLHVSETRYRQIKALIERSKS